MNLKKSRVKRNARLLEKEQHIQEFLEQNPRIEDGDDKDPISMLQVNSNIGVEFVHNWNKMINVGSIAALLQIGHSRTY